MHRTTRLALGLVFVIYGCARFKVTEGEPAVASATATATAPDFSAPATPPSADMTPDQRKAAQEKESEAIAAALKQITHSKTDYRISSADLMSVTVYQDLDMNRKVRVNANGTVSLPLIGAVEIGGMTLIEAQAKIEAKLAQFLVSPQVSLFIEEYGNKTVFVMGEVQKPGSYPVPTESRMTALISQ